MLELKAQVSAALGAAPAEALESPAGLALWGSVGLDVFLDGAGRVFAVEYEVGVPGETRTELLGARRIAALVIAAERRPALRFLLPQRAAGAGECLRCEGTGVVSEPPGDFIRSMEPLRFACPTCGGLGFTG